MFGKTVGDTVAARLADVASKKMALEYNTTSGMFLASQPLLIYGIWYHWCVIKECRGQVHQ